MNNNDLEQLLQDHGIKATANRLIILKALMNSSRPITMQDLTDEIESIDKSNVFRTLSTFREHGLVHVIEACDEGVMYELCRSDSNGPHNDIHPHFHCVVCHKVFCLKGVTVPKLNYPEGFEILEGSFLVNGICPECKARVCNPVAE